MSSPTPEAFLEKEKTDLHRIVRRKLRSCEKSIEQTMQSLEKGKAYHEVQHLAELIKANFTLLKKGLSEITVLDWSQENKEIKISLDPTATPKEQLQVFFTKCQKLKRSIVPLESHLELLNKKHIQWQTTLEAIEAVQTLEELQSLKTSLSLTPIEKKEKSVKTTVPSPYHVFYSETGFQILVGKNSAANHLLTFQVAHGSDLWLHAHQARGSHVLIKKKNATEIDQETIQDALQLALYFSKARSQAVHGHEVVIAERKYVSRFHNAPKGQVMVSKQKIVTAFLDKARIEKIKLSFSKRTLLT